jgi:hypothetical protein
MKRLVIFLVGLVFLGISAGDAAAQKKAKEKEAEMHAKTLKSDKDAKKRLAAATALYEIAEVKVSYVQPHTAILVTALKADADAMVRVAAGRVLQICEPEGKDVIPTLSELIKNDKENGAVLAIAVSILGNYGKDAKDAIPAIQDIKKREEAKEDPKTRDQNLLQAVNQALQNLSK